MMEDISVVQSNIPVPEGMCLSEQIRNQTQPARIGRLQLVRLLSHPSCGDLPGSRHVRIAKRHIPLKTITIIHSTTETIQLKLTV